MKKITLCFFMMTFFIWHSNAQFMEGFETGIPATWTVINGGDPNTWVAATPGTGTAHTGTNVAKLVYNTSVAHDDYLITPAITVSSGTVDRIKFWYKHRSNTFPELFDVLLSTGGNAATDFTETLAADVLPTTTWQELSYDLSAYEGQTVYVAFHSTTINEWELYLDDIVVDAQPTDILDYYNLQFPATGEIDAGMAFDVYAQAFEAGLTDVTSGQAPGIESWIGYSASNTDPSGAEWVWIPATFNVEAGNNDEYTVNLGAAVTTTGTYYYASRWRLNGGAYTYGGIQADGSYGGVWGEDNNISGVLTVNGPSNDECADAIALTVNADLNCAVFTGGSVIGASDSGTTGTTCFGTDDDDVWFSFVATATTHSVSLLNISGSTTDLYHAIYDASSGCDNLGAALVCSDPNSSTATGLTIGASYLIQVYTYTSTPGQTTRFDVCVGTPPGPPANDECDNAISLTVNEDLECAVVTAGTNASATASPQADDVTGTPNNDVWYSFTATNEQHRISLTEVVAVVGTSVDMGIGVYDGTGGCDALVFTDDSDPNTLDLTELTIGTLYYVRVYGWSSSPTTTAQTSYNICVGTPGPPPPAPDNDDCSGAIALTAGTTFSDNSLDGTVLGATLNGETSSCGSNGPGVWYSVVVPSDGNITIETGPDAATSDTGFDSVIEAFSGTCGNLTSIDCDDDGASSGNFSILNLTGLEPNSTIFIRVWEFGGNDTEPFAISAYNSTLSIVDINNPNAFTYFPNPVKNELTLKAQSTIQNVKVYNMLGQEVLRSTPNALEGMLDMTPLQTGSYFVKVSINDVVETIRVIKQ